MPRVLTVGMEDDIVAYWVARSKVNNPDILEGPEKFHRFVVIEFPSFEKAVACHESVEYLEAAAHRRKGGASELEIVICHLPCQP
jgi:uncharacterized protein (DUF1330 family)